MTFTYEEAERRYTERFTHTETLGKETITFYPRPVCNYREMDAIFAACDNWDQVLTKMRACVGTPGPRKTY